MKPPIWDDLAPASPDQKIATIELDATVIESWKQEAQPTYFEVDDRESVPS